MSAEPITDALVGAIGAGDYDFIVANYANADMVGHTGVWDAAVRAAEVLDACLARVTLAVLAGPGALIVTGDHGNIEETRDENGAPQTKHTTSQVPFLVVGAGLSEAAVGDGILADVAPTICGLMGLAPTPSMTGHNLIRGGAGGSAS
jgi:2,3-bisphosphoglycerate-independent phosphoglycerate mutase